MAASLLEQLVLTARAVAARLCLPALVRGCSLPDLLAAVTPDRARARPMDLDDVERAVGWSERVLERIPAVPDTCLYRSLARYSVLRRAGHPASFVMGVQRGAPDLTGHAWVELDGEPAFETLEPGLAVTFAYPRPSPSSP